MLQYNACFNDGDDRRGERNKKEWLWGMEEEEATTVGGS